MRLLLCTHNEHKRREFARLLPGHDVQALSDDFALPPEDGDTFEANALGKARAAAELAGGSGALAIADDSGIEAAALGGAPGVRSARYAGEHASDAQNLAKLLAEAPAGSALRYVCAIVLIEPSTGAEQTFLGYCSGTLTHDPRGERGFGYDPAFVPDEQLASGAGEPLVPIPGVQPAPVPGEQSAPVPGERPTSGVAHAERPVLTMAELSDAEKDAISHRGRAVRELLDWLQAARLD